MEWRKSIDGALRDRRFMAVSKAVLLRYMRGVDLAHVGTAYFRPPRARVWEEMKEKVRPDQNLYCQAKVDKTTSGIRPVSSLSVDSPPRLAPRKEEKRELY